MKDKLQIKIEEERVITFEKDGYWLYISIEDENNVLQVPLSEVQQQVLKEFLDKKTL